MTDPLTEVVTLLRPGTPFSKVVNAAGQWRVSRARNGPFYCVVVEGSTRLTLDDREPLFLEAGDFVLVPDVYGTTMSSLVPPPGADTQTIPVRLDNGEYRLGPAEGPDGVRMVIGHCVFASDDAALLVALLPQVVHVRGEPRLSLLVDLLADEARASRPGRDVIVERLMEVLLIEALRSSANTQASPGLLRGLADERLAIALRRMHEAPALPWTVPQLAKEAALSRSAFFDRFGRAVGVSPMEYLLAWRMALAKDLLRKTDASVAAVADRVGYSSASTFSVAFTRHVGMPPTRYARQLPEIEAADDVLHAPFASHG